MSKEGLQFIYLSVILIDSVFTTGKNYYPQVYLEECKYAITEKSNGEKFWLSRKFWPGNSEKKSDGKKFW